MDMQPSWKFNSESLLQLLVSSFDWVGSRTVNAGIIVLSSSCPQGASPSRTGELDVNCRI